MNSQTWDTTCPDCTWAFEGLYEVLSQTDACEATDVELSHGLSYYESYGYVFLFGVEDGSGTSWYPRGLASWDGTYFYYGYSREYEEQNGGVTWYYSMTLQYYGMVTED